MCNSIYQNHLALDNLLASDGGVCGKITLINCFLQIDDEGKVTEELLIIWEGSPVPPVEILKGCNLRELFGG